MYIKKSQLEIKHLFTKFYFSKGFKEDDMKAIEVYLIDVAN